MTTASSATEMYASSNMPPAARACLPEYVRKDWPKAFERFHKYVSGGIESHRTYINQLDRKRMELWEDLQDRERRLKKGKTSEVEITEAIQQVSRSVEALIRHYGYHSMRQALEFESTINREVKRALKNPTTGIRESIEKLGKDIQREQDEIREIQKAPESIVPLMSWLEWFKTLSYDKMQEEIRRIENKKRTSTKKISDRELSAMERAVKALDNYPPATVSFGNSGAGYKEQNYT